METRRRFLEALGASSTVLLAGCSTQSQQDTPTRSTAAEETTETAAEETTEDTTTEGERATTREPAAYKQEVPVDFPLYKDRLEQVDEEEVETSVPTDVIVDMLDGETGLDAAAQFAELATRHEETELGIKGATYSIQPDKAYHVAQNLYQTKAENPDANLPTLAVNVNYASTGDSEPILEVYPIEDGKLQTPPILRKNGTTHKPGDKQPDTYKNLRNSEKAAATLPQDHDGLEKRIEVINPSEEEIREGRAGFQEKGDWALFGVDEGDADIVFYDAESSNMVFDATHNPEKVDDPYSIIREFNIEAAEYVGNGEITTAEYTEEGWEFEAAPQDWEFGDKLPGE